MALPTASDNVFPKVIISEAAAPASPSAGQFKLYVDSSDHLLKYKNSAGTAVTLGQGVADQGVITYLDGTVAAAPATPAAGKLRLYAKTGKVLAVKDDAGVETVLGAGGGGGSDLVQTNSGAGSVYVPGLRGSADVKPASPSAFDDEFEALSGWTTLGTLDTSNVTDFPSHWHVKRTNGASAADGIYKTAPSMPFTVTAKLKAATLLNNYDAAGILLTEASPGKLCSYNLVMNGSTLYASLYLWTNRTTFSTTTDVTTGTVVWYPIFQYLRVIVTSSTSVTCAYSRDGQIWRTTHTTLTTGLTVANVGLMIGDPAAAGTVEAAFDWIRFS